MIIYFFPVIGFIFSWLIGAVLFESLFFPKQPENVLGVTFHGLFYKLKQPLLNSLGNYLDNTVKNNVAIKTTLLNPDNLTTVKPEIEKHVAHFLEVKLAEQLPVISMFVGKNTLDKVKKSLMQEIDVLLPNAIEQFLTKFQSNFDGKKFALQIINEQTEQSIITTLKKNIKSRIQLAVGITGLLTGILIMVLMLILPVH